MQLRTIRTALLSTAGLLATLLTGHEASAALRFTVNGGYCSPWGSGYGYNKNGGSLNLIVQQTNTWAMCEIPTGTDLVELATASARTFSTVNLRLKNSGPVARTVETGLYIVDYDSDSVCGCDVVSSSINPGVFLNRTLNVAALGASCGGCAGADYGNWTPLVSITMAGAANDVLTIKRLQVFDDT